MKIAIILSTVLLLLLFAGYKVGLVGFHYLLLVQNEPLHHPIKVLKLDGNRLTLLNGQTLTIDPVDFTDVSTELNRSNDEVDLEINDKGQASIFARHAYGICGTPWAQPIHIPLFADVMNRNHRVQIATGVVEVPATNRSDDTGHS